LSDFFRIGHQSGRRRIQLTIAVAIVMTPDLAGDNHLFPSP
jgi:hypothetical protein